MIKNKRTSFIIIITSIIIILGIVFSKINKQDTSRIGRIVLKQNSVKLLSRSLIDEYCPINNIQIYLGNDTTKIERLYDVINKPCIIYRFSGRTCNVCIDFVFKELIKTFPDFDQNNNIIVICNNTNPRIKESYFGKKLYSIKDSTLNLAIEHSEIPYVFILDKDQRCKHLFIPDKSFPELTDTYFNSIKLKYFNY